MNKNVVYANGFDDSAKLLGTKRSSNFAASKSDGMKNLTKIRRDVNCFSASDALIKVSFITFVV